MHTTPHGASTPPLADVSFFDLVAELGRRLAANVVTDEPRRPGPLRVAQVGNLEPPHSTENELRKALIECGHEPTTYQESDAGAFTRVAEATYHGDVDLVLWTRTLWPRMDFDAMRSMLGAARANGVPVVGYHLDLWWGLPRSAEIGHHPFFEVDLLCTADGGHDAEWEAAGIAHAWFPPAVSAAECVPAEGDPRFAADIAFVGSHAGYHPEDDRLGLVDFLRRRFGDRVRFWPEPGQPAVRGDDLRRLYASVKVAVGASCLAGRFPRYVSDRLTESAGRGAFQVWPHIDGIFPEMYADGEHVLTFPPGDYEVMAERIEWALDHPAERATMAAAARAHTIEHHTYTVRMEQLVDLLAERHLLRAVVA